MTDTTHVPDVPDVPPSAGALLRAAREARGLSVDEIAGRLRLRPPLVEALERDDLAALGTGPYGRGQLRNYARLVGVDEQRVLPPPSPTAYTATATASGGLRRPSLVQRPRPRWPMRLLTLAVLGIVAILGVLWGYGSGPAPEQKPEAEPASPTASSPPAPPAPRPPAPGVPASPAAPESIPAGSILEAAPDPAAPPPAAPTGASQTPIDIPGLPAVTAPAPQSQSGSAGPAAAPAELVLTFTAPCWVEVTDQTGARLLYRMARAGDRHVLQGSAPFAVTLGNAGAAQLTYNGAPFAKPQIDRPVARLRVGD